MEREMGDQWALPKQYRDLVAHCLNEFTNGDPETGRKHLYQAIGKSVWAKNALIQAGLALDSSDTKSPPLTILLWELAASIDPMDEELRRMLKVRYRRSQQRQKMKESSETLRWIKRVRKLSNQCDEALRKGRHDDAIVDLRQLIKERPAVPRYHADLGECLLQTRQFEAARDLFRDLMNKSDNQWIKNEFERELARALFGLGKVEEAKAILQDNNFLTFEAQRQDQPLPEGFTISLLNEVDIAALKQRDDITFHEMEANGPVIQRRPRVIPPMMDIPEEYESQRHGLFVAELPNTEVLTHDGLIIRNDQLICPNPALTSKSKQENIHFFTRCHNERNESLVVTPQKQTLRIDKAALITSRVATNYFHWLLEQLPRVLLLEGFAEHDDAPLLVRRDMPQQHFEALKLIIGDRRDVIMLNARSRVRVNHLILPSLPGYHPPEYYHYVQHGRRAPFAIEVHPYAIRSIRKRLLEQVKPAPDLPRLRLFLTRPEMGVRGLTNETELYPLFEDLGFTIFNPAKYSFTEQISIFARAEMLVGNLGAAFTNMIFTPQDCEIIGLQNQTADSTLFDQIALTLGQRFTVIKGRSIPNTGNQIHSHFHLNPDYLMKNIKNLLTERNATRDNSLHL